MRVVALVHQLHTLPDPEAMLLIHDDLNGVVQERAHNVVRCFSAR